MNTLVNHHPGAAILCSFSHRGFFVSHRGDKCSKKEGLYFFVTHIHTHPNFKSRINYIFYDMMYHDVFFFPSPFPQQQQASQAFQSDYIDSVHV